jgi:hypothetical protein
MRDHGISNPGHAFRAMMFDKAVQKTNFDAKRKAAENQKDLHRKGIVTGGTAKKPDAGQKPDMRGKGYGQAEEMALAHLGLN